MRFFQHAPSLAPDHTWHQKEEFANTLTHFVAFLACLVGFSFLLVRAYELGSTRSFIACCIYAGSVTITFLASSIYHYSENPKYKHFFHICDHMVIYVMIAGTYTPFTVVILHGDTGWTLFAIIWALTALGFIFKLFFISRFRMLSAITYVMMGWIGVLAIVPIIESLPAGGLFWLILGGALYTIGVLFFMMHSIPFAHTVWHLFVIGGTLAHFICIYQYVAIR